MFRQLRPTIDIEHAHGVSQGSAVPPDGDAYGSLRQFMRIALIPADAAAMNATPREEQDTPRFVRGFCAGNSRVAVAPAGYWACSSFAGTTPPDPCSRRDGAQDRASPTERTHRGSHARGAGFARRAKPAGFTLLELVVVLAIMALVVGVAAVRIFTLIESWRVRTQLEGIEQQFAHLPVLARSTATRIVLPPSADENSVGAGGASISGKSAIALPKDWLITFDAPLVVRASGFCEGARITLQRGSRRYERNVLPPFCKVVARTAETNQ